MLVEQSRTWQNLTTERKLDEIYTNNTGGDIIVAVNILIDGEATNASASITVNGHFLDFNISDSVANVTQVVPDGATYVVQLDTVTAIGSTVRNWMEYT